MPNEIVIRDWADALDSGRFKQTKGYLRRDTKGQYADTDPGYCCLGVLCELAAKAGVIPEPTLVDTTFSGRIAHYGVGDEETDIGLPPSVREWAGLEPGDLSVVSVPHTGVTFKVGLAELNDEYDVTFPDIASLIRENFLADSVAGQPA